ncbi:MAG: hypothetical protein ACKOYN_12205 [Planctomycetota bacterium]
MARRELVPTITCPHCWWEFPPAQFRYVSEHESLRGDLVLGDAEQLRFLPSRFDGRCRAIDPAGAACTRLACPRCHLEIPPTAAEIPQTIISIVGAPGCGKSVMLAAASFSLRSGLVVQDLDFTDADPTLNDLTVELESSLFRSGAPERPAMIPKTDLSGRLYRSFRVGGAVWKAPKPQLFTLSRGGMSRMLCLYDNAGEHFEPGRDSAQEPVTRHLAVSRSLVFVVDPTQDNRVAEMLGGRESVIARGGGGTGSQRQDLVLIEAINRTRRLRGLSSTDRLPFRIIVALAKADIWGSAVDARLGEPASDRPSVAVPTMEELQPIHEQCARFLTRGMPELVAAARALDPRFRIVPFSGLGRPPSRLGAEDTRLAIRPQDVHPVWPAAPIIVALAEAEPEMFPEFLP